MPSFDKLMAPGRIGGMELKNRIIMTAMGTNTAVDGEITNEEIAYYEARAQGGAALIQLGSVTVAYPEAIAAPRQLALSDNKYIPQLRKLADTVHKYGAKLSVQLQHPGQVSFASAWMGYPLLVPSIPDYIPGDMGTYHELSPQQVAALTAVPPNLQVKVATQEDIDGVVKGFADAAQRALEAGVDAIEIHGAHGYLLHAFLNPAYNKRTDDYGGTPENRARLYVEILKAIRDRVGDKMPILCKIDSIEFLTGNGITNEAAIETAKILETAGADAICCSAYAPSYKVVCPTASHIAWDRNKIVPYARKIKEAVNIPVTCVGRIDIEDAESFIGENAFDFLQMGRKLLADPELPNKVREGHIEDIRLCINCYYCVSKMYEAASVECAINAACCHETHVSAEPACKKKRVLVIGAGPAGMEAARVAALRGHDVTVIEKENKVGGTLFFASVCTPTDYNVVTYLTTQLEKLGVDMRLDVKADADFIRQFNPDAVILGTGTRRDLPEIPGIHQEHVMSGDTARQMITGSSGKKKERGSLVTTVMTAAGRTAGLLDTPESICKASKLWMPLGKNVVLVGGELVGVEMAGFLTERGRKVTILEEGSYIGEGLALCRRWKEVYGLHEAGVKVNVGCKVTNIGKKDVTYLDGNGQERTVQADSVIITSGAVPNDDLARSLGKKPAFEIHTAGDCDGISWIDGAIREGNEIGRRI